MPSAESSVLEEHEGSRSGIRRLPLVPVTIAFVAGILVDRYLHPPPLLLWIAAGLMFVGWLFSLRLASLRPATLLVLLLCGSAGALHHHQFWWSRPRNDIGQFLGPVDTLIRVRGTLASRPIVYPRRTRRAVSAIPETAMTRVELNCHEVVTEAGTTRVNGRLSMHVYDRVDGLNPGDAVDVQGFVSGLPGSRNPGEFDLARSLQRRGIRGTLRVRDSALVRRVSESKSLLTRLRLRLRQRCENVLAVGVRDDIRPVAAALLLGDRTMIDRNTRTDFIQSGTMHLLAISGLHTGILAGFTLACARLLRFSSRGSVVIVLMLMTIYLGIADLRPPVIRAYVLILVWGAGRLLLRPAISANSLALAALIVLLLNPSDLFDVGAQLSFLAVASILWLGSRRREIHHREDVASNQSSRSDVLVPAWRRWLAPAGRRVKSGYVLSGTIWLVSAPLVAFAFNVISPVGIVINVLLIPVVAVALCLGFVALAVGMLHPVAGFPLAMGCDNLLRFLLSVVETASSLYIGHLYVPGPPVWWLLGIYALIAAAMIWSASRRRSQWVWCVTLLWLIFGLSVGLQSEDRRDAELNCTFLSVGHGVSIMIETPSGKTVVYDVGCLTDGEFAGRTLERALWARGRTRIDVLVLSHSDVDHYNGAESLLGTTPVGTMVFSRHFVDAAQEDALALCAVADVRGTSLVTTARGDRLNIDPEVRISVLHPRAGNEFSSDNALSVVLLIEYAGKRILLTGDIEKQGLNQLLRQRAIDVDVLLAPHHGSPSVDLKGLTDWCTPELIVVSAGRRFSMQRLREENPGLHRPVLSTHEEGAIEVTITSGGKLSHQTMRETR